MAVMSIAEAWPAAGRPFTVADLDRILVAVTPSALVAGLIAE